MIKSLGDLGINIPDVPYMIMSLRGMSNRIHALEQENKLLKEEKQFKIRIT